MKRQLIFVKISATFSEKEIFSSYLKLEFVQPYRNKTDGKEETSWLWHYDDCPKEFIKLFLYLTDVKEDSGCMEYVEEIIHTHRASPNWVTGDQLYPKSRVPPSVVATKEVKKFYKFYNNWLSSRHYFSYNFWIIISRADI